MVPVLPSFLEETSGDATLASWWLFPLADEVVGVPALMEAIEALKEQGLTGLVVVRTFIHLHILPLRERAHLLWQHQGITDSMMEFPYPILEEFPRVLMIRVVSADYPGAGVGPIHFSGEHSPPAGHPFTEMIPEPPLHLLWWSGCGWPCLRQGRWTQRCWHSAHHRQRLWL
jgi:hypothetical protein